MGARRRRATLSCQNAGRSSQKGFGSLASTQTTDLVASGTTLVAAQIQSDSMEVAISGRAPGCMKRERRFVPWSGS